MAVKEPLVAHGFSNTAGHFVVPYYCSGFVEGQPGFGFRVAAVDQAGRDANDVSSNCPTSGVDRVRGELEGDDDGGNVSGSHSQVR